MGKAKRSRRENLSDSDREKLKNYKKWDKSWKANLKKYWAWCDKYKQASPEQKIKMKKELELSSYRKEHGLEAKECLSEDAQLIFDLKIKAFQEADLNPKQTEDDIKLTEYSRK